jgi:hypothetical protein
LCLCVSKKWVGNIFLKSKEKKIRRVELIVFSRNSGSFS